MFTLHGSRDFKMSYRKLSALLMFALILQVQSLSAFRAVIGFMQQRLQSDPYWSNVSLLLRCENNTITEYKSHSYTNYAVTNSVLQSKFGLESCSFDGSTSYLAFGDQSDFNVGSGEFTVEAWVYDVSGATNGYVATASRFNGAGNGFFIGHDYSITGDQQCFSGCDQITPSSFITLNSWHHVAYVKSGGTNYYYIDGVSMGSITSTTSATWGNLVIGRLSPDQNSYYFNGYMDEVRITKGVARYTSNFTPPTLQFPNQ